MSKFHLNLADISSESKRDLASSRRSTRISTARAIVANGFDSPDELRARHTQSLTSRREERKRSMNTTSNLDSGTSTSVWAKWQILKLEEAGRYARGRSVSSASRSSSTNGTFRRNSSVSHLLEKQEDIDFYAVGENIGSALRELEIQSRRYTKSHLDVVYALKMVEKVWLKACEMGDGLDEKEFTDFLSSILSMEKDQLNILFHKMDADSDGTLTWDEYLSYLLKEVTHTWKYSMAKGTWHIRETDAIPCDARTPVRQILSIPGDPILNSPAKYVLSGTDSSVQVWNADTMTLQCQLPLNSDAIKAKSRVHMKASQRIVKNAQSQISPGSPADGSGGMDGRSPSVLNRAPSSMSRPSMYTLDAAKRMDKNQIRELAEYLTPERSAGQRQHPFTMKVKDDCLPHSAIAYYSKQKQIVVAGLDRSISFYSPNFKEYVLQDSFYGTHIPQCLNIDSMNNTDYLFVGDTVGNISTYNAFTKNHISTVNIHGTESVRRTALVPGLGLISGGLDSRIAITDISKGEVVRYLSGHERGVYALAYSSSYRCLLSAGFEPNVYVWDPYYQKPIGHLHAQHNNIVDVLVNEPKNQIITVSADKKIKVFDIRTFKCIQSSVDSTHHSPSDVLSAAVFDSDKQRVVVAGSKMRTWPVQIAPGNKSIRGGTAHLNLVVKVCYSPVFKQLISIGVDETVRMWDIATGKCAFTFNTTHYSPISAACIDHRAKRFISAASDGTVKMWNFNNGAVMHEYEDINQADIRQKEITQLVYLPNSQSSIAGVVDGQIGRLPEPCSTKTTSFILQKKDDVEVLCMDAISGVMVTGTSSGELLFWSVDSCHLSHRMSLPHRPRHSVKERRDTIESLITTNIAPQHLIQTSNSVNTISCFSERKQPFAMVGMDDGSVHFVHVKKAAVVLSLTHLMSDSVVRIVLSEDHSRVLVVDSSSKARLLDFSEQSFVNTTNPAQLQTGLSQNPPVINEWVPHKSGIVTDAIFIKDCSCFVTSSDNGEVILWNTEGERVAEFGERKRWPLRAQGDGKIVIGEQREDTIQRDLSFNSVDSAIAQQVTKYTANERNETTGNDSQQALSSSADDVPVYAKPRVRYEDANPPYRPKTLTKHGLRTANFNLTPLSSENESKKRTDVSSNSCLFLMS